MFESNCTSAFGQKPSFGAFGSSSSSTSPFGSSIQQSQPALGSSLFYSSSQPSFGTASAPAFGASIAPAFGVANISPFGSTGISPFTCSGGAFGGVSNAPVFSAASTPAFGASSTGIFGASSASAPSFNFGSTPAHFASQASTTAFGSPGFGQSSFGALRGGSRVTPYAPTVEVDAGTTTTTLGKLVSISAMPAYKDKSCEELRWVDYQSGDRGGPALGNQSAGGATVLFGQSIANPFSFSSTSNPFAPKLGFSDSGFGSSVSSPGYTPAAHLTPSSPFVSTASTSSLISSQTPAFSTTTPSMFSTTGSSTFGTSNSLFGTSMGQGTSNAVGSCLNFNNRMSLPLFELSTPSMLPSSSSVGQSMSFLGQYTSTFGFKSSPAFGAASTPAFGAASTPAFGASSTGIFGASSASAPSFNFGSTPAPFGQSIAFGQLTRTHAFWQSIPAFVSSPFGVSPCGGQANQIASQASTTAFGSQGQSSLGAQRGGSRVTPYAPTVEVDGGTTTTTTPGKLVSISAMPAYKDKSCEELRWEDYQSGDRGGPAQGNPSAGGATSLFGQSSANPFYSSSTSNPFAPKLGLSDSGFGYSAAHLAPSSTFGSTSSTSSLFSSQTPAFPTTTPSMFSTTGSSTFGKSNSLFGTSMGQGTTNAVGSSLNFSNPLPLPLFELSTPLMPPSSPIGQSMSFFGQYAPTFGHSTLNPPSSGFSGHFLSSTPSFGPTNESNMDSKCGEGKFERISGTVIAFNIGDLVLIACDGMWFKHGNPPKVDGYHFVKVCWVVDEVFIAVAGCLRTAFSIITSIVRVFETDPPRKMKKIANMVQKRADGCGDCEFIIGGKLKEGTNLELWKVCRPADNLPYRSYRLSTGNMFIIGGGSTDALARVKQTLGGDLSQINQWNPLQIMDLLHEALLSASSKKENATGGDFNCVAVNARGVNTFATSTPSNPSAENVGDRGYSGWKYDAVAVKPRWYEFKPN